MTGRKRRWISAQQIIEAYDNEEITMSLIQTCLASARRNESKSIDKWQEARDVIFKRPDNIIYREPKSKH